MPLISISFFSGIQSSSCQGDIQQQTQSNSSQLEIAIVSGGTQQQERPHEVQQPQPRQEESAGTSVGGGGGKFTAHQFIEAEPSKSFQEAKYQF